MIKYLLAFLIIPFAVKAQTGVFTVKKNNPHFVPGFYCSDYMTDGRSCFYFDTLNKVHFFISSQSPEKIPVAYMQSPASYYTVPYVVNADTVSFIASIYNSPSDFNPIATKQTTTVTGLIKEDMIRLTIIVEGGMGRPSKKEIYIRRIPQSE